MKNEEEMGGDRGINFETDDEDNLADDGGSGDDNTGYTSTSRDSSYNQLPSSRSIPWPQSYRQSIDVYSSFTPTSVGFIGGSILGGSSLGISGSIFSSSSFQRPQASLRKPLLTPTTLGKEEHQPLPVSRLPSTQLSCFLPPTQQCSSTKAVLNGINVLCGVGLLSTPFAVFEGGWMSLVILFIFAVISCYTGILLKRCLESSPELQTYPDIGQAAFGVKGRVSVAIILYMELYAICVEYLILMSDNLSSLFPNASMNLLGIHLTSNSVFAIATTLMVLPTVWLRNLSLLSYLSAGGVIASIFVAICLFWVGIVDRVGFHPSGTPLNLVDLPMSLGIYSYCYSGHSVFPNIYSSMKEPSQFSTVLIVSISICFSLYLGVAVCGFLMFGDTIRSQFTLSMPRKFTASKIALFTTVVNPFCKYALSMTPIALSLEELCPSGQLESHLVPILIRTTLVLSTLVVALVIPLFSYVMALTGSFLAVLVTFIFPCSSYLKIHHGRVDRWQIAICVLIIIVGVACSSIGSYSAIKKIINSFS